MLFLRREFSAARLRLAAALVVISWLSACAGPRMVDTEVQTFVGTKPVAANASYQFERLPSQATKVGQDKLEAAATQALAKVGLSRASGAAPYAVQLGFDVVEFYPASATPLSMRGWRGRPDIFHSGFGTLSQQLWYRHTLSLLLRDLGSSQVVYESNAVVESPWPDGENLIPALLGAALQGYPNPPSGVRKVTVAMPESEAAQ